MISKTINGISLFRGNFLRERTCTEVSSAEILKSPRNYSEGFRSVDRFFEDCIEKNIISRFTGDKNKVMYSNFLVTEVRALINNLSDDNKQKLAEIICALSLDKKNLNNFRGIIFSGGEIRVIPEVGAGMLVNVISLLSGMNNFNSFYGTSAGVLPASGFAFHILNSKVLKVTTETKFEKFYRNRDEYKKWVNRYLRMAYKFTSGESVDVVKVKHLRKLGTNLDALIGTMFPRPEAFLLIKGFEEKYGLNTDEFDVAEIAAESANLVGLFFSPFDLTFGNCFVEDGKGKKHYILDPGLLDINSIPLNAVVEGIEDYKKDHNSKPPFYFLIGNKKVDKLQIKTLKELGGRDTQVRQTKKHLLTEVVFKINDIVDRTFFPKPIERINSLGVSRSYIGVACSAIDSRTGEIAKLEQGDLAVSEHVKKTLLTSSIPTIDSFTIQGSKPPFSTAIDQLYENLVDPDYILFHGHKGKSPYELYLDDIDRKINTGNNGSSENIVSARILLESVKRSAAM